MSSTAVVILAYNSKKYLEKFLPGIFEHTREATIWIVDNASTDGTLNWINSNYAKQVKVLSFSENYGFAGGYNKAINKIECDNLVLLNADVEVSPNWLKPLIEKLSSSAIGAVQPKILDYSKQTHFEYAGAAGGYVDVFGYPYCRGRVFEECEKDESQYDDSKEIFWATGACLVIKRNDFLSVGGFDDRFFAHMEEIDLCWRLQLLGKKIVYEPSSTVFHVGGGSLHKSNPFKTFLNFRNSLLMLTKNLAGNELVPVIFTRLILDGVAGFKYLLGGSFKDFLAVIKAHFGFYYMLPYALKKRKEIIRLQKVPRKEVFLIWEYFVKKNKKYNQIHHDA